MTDTSWGEIRTSPSGVGIVAGFAKPGDQFKVVSKDDWFQIILGKYTGAFVNKKSVRELPQANPTNFGKVVGKEIPVMAGPSVDSGVKGIINNTPELVLEAQGDWYKIVEDEYSGYFIQAKNILKSDDIAIAAIQSRGYAAKKPEAGVKSHSPSVKAHEVPPQEPTAAIPAPAAEPAPQASAIAIPTPPPWDRKTEQRFDDQVAKVFNNKKPPGEVEVLMPVYYEEFESTLGQVNTFIKKDQPLQIETETLLKYLKRVALPQWFKKNEIAELFSEDKLKKNFLADPNNWLSIKAFENTGIKVEYDEAKLAIRISIPPELRRPGISSLSRYGFSVNMDNVERPSFLSGYLNINATDAFDTRQTTFSDRRAPLAAQFEHAVNLGGLVFEAYGSYLENRDTSNSTSPFARQDVRIVKDFPNQIIRATAGDLNYPIIGFQNFKAMGGASFSSQFSMSPSKLTYPSGNYEFFLQRKSKVYVFVNNNLAQALDLPAGKHLLQEFPFAAGSNDIRLEILDDVGRSETVQFSYFSNSEMLKTGLGQYSYAFGEPSIQVVADRVYDSNNPTYSGFHRYGLSEHHTIGANVQGDKNQLMLGLDHLMSTNIGYFKTEAAMTKNVLMGQGGAAALHYIYTDYQGEEKTQRTRSFGLIYHTQNFAGFDTTLSGFRKRLQATGNYSAGLSRVASLNLGLDYSFNYRDATNVSDGFTLSGGLNRRFESGISANLSIRHTRSDVGANDLSAVLFLLWSFPKERQTASVLFSSADSATIADWSYNPSSGADAWNVTGEAKSNPTQQGYTGQLNFNGNRARALVNYQELIQPNPNLASLPPGAPAKISNELTTLQLGTALVFAGGHFAISRPVTDSFAIISPYANLRGQVLQVNPDSQNNYVARTTWAGAAAAPELSSYNFSSIIVGGKELPSDVTIPKDHFDIYPSYKSGYAFAIGTNATIYLTAHLYLQDGNALNYQSGRAINLDHPDETPIIVFTNRKGVLRSEGFQPGHFRLEIATDTYAPIEFVIPDSAKNDFDLGKLILKLK